MHSETGIVLQICSLVVLLWSMGVSSHSITGKAFDTATMHTAAKEPPGQQKNKLFCSNAAKLFVCACRLSSMFCVRLESE